MLTSYLLMTRTVSYLYSRIMPPKDADGMANSVDPDQTAPRAV